MIRETSLEIDATLRQSVVQSELRQARRNRVRYIDCLLNQLEQLNLEDAPGLPPDLRDELAQFFSDNGHVLGRAARGSLTINECMDALYDVQDMLMTGGDDEDDA